MSMRNALLIHKGAEDACVGSDHVTVTLRADLRRLFQGPRDVLFD